MPPPTPGDALGLNSTIRWSGTEVTYAFPDTVQGFTNGSSSYSPFNEPGSMVSLSAFGKDTLHGGFQQWNALTALSITEAAPGTFAQINAGGSTVPSTAWAYYPGSSVVSGDIWFNTSRWFLDALSSAPEPVIGSYAYATGMHELGHALGLKHPHQSSGGGNVIMPAAYDAVEFTIMSYRSFPGGPTGAYTMETWGYPQSPMMLDIAMIQAIYGADYSTRAGDTTYTVSTTTGEFFVDGVSLGVPGANRVFRTIWDGDGADHIDLANYTTSMYADLTPGRGIRFDTDGTFQAARLANGVHAGFNIYMSLLHDGDTRSLIENLTTGSGDDILIGNAAANVLTSAGGNNTFTGGLGADTLILGSGADTIRDTLAGLDGDRVIGFDPTQDRVVLEGLGLSSDRFIISPAGILQIDATGNGVADARLDLGSLLAGHVVQATTTGGNTIITLQAAPDTPHPPPTEPTEPETLPPGTPLVRIDFDNGTVTDDSGFGTAMTWSATGLGAEGLSDTGFRLTGTTKVVIDRFTPQLQNLENFSIDLALNRDAGSAGNFLDIHTTFDAVVRADGAVTLRMMTTQAQYLLETAPGLVTADTWHQITIGYDSGGAGLSVFVDGTLAAQTAASGALTGLGTYTLVVGNTWSTSLMGTVDNFIITDTAPDILVVDTPPPTEPETLPPGTPLVRIDFDNGTVTDDSGFGTAMTWSATGLGAEGLSDTGFRLTGTTKVVIDRFTPQLQNLENFSIDLALNRDAGSAGNFLDIHTAFDAVVRADGAVALRMVTTEAQYLLETAPGLVTADTWHKITIGYDAGGSGLSVFVDGTLAAQTAASGALTGLGTYTLVVGDTWSTSLRGTIDNFIITDAAPSAAPSAAPDAGSVSAGQDAAPIPAAPDDSRDTDPDAFDFDPAMLAGDMEFDPMDAHAPVAMDTPSDWDAAAFDWLHTDPVAGVWDIA